MKALIAPYQSFDFSWVSSWENNNGVWEPVRSQIYSCQRVVEIKQDDQIFEVANPLFWVTCPENCVAGDWYYKDGQCNQKPEDVQMPLTQIEVLP